MKIHEAAALIGTAAGALSTILFCRAAYKKGCRDGAKNREEEIMVEYASYIPVGEIVAYAEDLIEEAGVSEDFPLLMIRPDSYKYLNETDPNGLYK